MSDDLPLASVSIYIDEAVLQWLARPEIPPDRFTELAEAIEPYLAPAKAAIDLGVRASRRGTRLLQYGPNEIRFPLPVPTAEELEKKDADLRARLLPEAPEQELQQAVWRLRQDPKKLNLAVILTNALKRAAPILTPWLVFVLVYWLATKLNADEVGALALAFAVMLGAKPDS